MAWVKAIRTDEIDDHEGIGMANVDGCRVAFFAVGGRYYATSDACTHGRASLSQGSLDGHLIECPLHQGLFDVRTGAAVGPPCTEGVRSFPVKVAEGFVYVQIESERGHV